LTTSGADAYRIFVFGAGDFSTGGSNGLVDDTGTVSLRSSILNDPAMGALAAPARSPMPATTAAPIARAA
jgi:hypothetical protein